MTFQSDEVIDFALARLKEDLVRIIDDGNAPEENASASESHLTESSLLQAFLKLLSDFKMLEANFSDSMKALRALRTENSHLKESIVSSKKTSEDLDTTKDLLKTEIARSRQLEHENQFVRDKNANLVDFMRTIALSPEDDQDSKNMLCAFVETLNAENQRLRDVIKEIRRVQISTPCAPATEAVDRQPSRILITPPRSPESHSSRARGLQTPSSIQIEIDISDLAEQGDMADVGRLVSPSNSSEGSPLVALQIAPTVEPELLLTPDEDREVEAEIDASLEASNFDSSHCCVFHFDDCDGTRREAQAHWGYVEA